MSVLPSSTFDWAVLGERLLARWQRSALARFCPWWRDQLLACLPQRLRQRLPKREPLGSLHWPLAHDAPLASERPLRLLLAAELVLICERQLPRVSRKALGKILAFELDRYTPYTGEQVYFDVRVEGASSSGQARVRLVLIERGRLDELLAQARASGLRGAGVDALDEQGRALGVELMPESAEQRSERLARWLRRGLAGVLVLLALACMGAWVGHREQALEARREQLAQVRQQAMQVDAMRKQLQARSALEHALRLRESTRLSSVGLLDLLSRCLPQDTWLDELRINADGSLLFSGSSAQASGLPAQLAQCAGLEKVTFQGGIQPDRQTRLERFTLLAQRPEHEE